MTEIKSASEGEETYYEALARYVANVAKLAYYHGYEDGAIDGLQGPAQELAAETKAARYSNHGFHDLTVQEYAPPLPFTREDVTALRMAAATLDGRAGEVVDTQGPNGIAAARNLNARADALRDWAVRIEPLLPTTSLRACL